MFFCDHCDQGDTEMARLSTYAVPGIAQTIYLCSVCYETIIGNPRELYTLRHRLTQYSLTLDLRALEEYAYILRIARKDSDRYNAYKIVHDLYVDFVEQARQRVQQVQSAGFVALDLVRITH